MRFVWSAVITVVLSVPVIASAADGDEKTPAAAGTGEALERIQRLEKELQQLKAETLAGLPATMDLDLQDKKDAPKPEVEFRASFTDGFHIKSSDGNFDLHIGGRVEEEYRYTFNRHSDGAVRTSVNTFYSREEFISVDGTIYKNWGFKVNGDFSASGAALTEEYYVEYKELKEFRLLFGSFKQPLSMETTDSPRFAELINRSPMARFIPNFDLGIKAYGSFLDTLFTYELAVTNGRSHTANVGRGVVDDNDGKEYAGRFTTAPFVQDKESFLKGLRIGVYASMAHIGQNATINPTGWPGNIATNELAVTYMALALPATGRFYGDRYRVGGEFTYAVGPFMARGEYMQRNDEYVIPAQNKNGLMTTNGFYGELTYVLTGEDRIPNARIVPKHPFSVADGGMGAWELATRFGSVAMDRHTVADVFGVNMAQNSNRAQSITLGFNWWPVQNVKFSLDYIGEYYGSNGVQLSGTHHGSHVNGMVGHFQVDF